MVDIIIFEKHKISFLFFIYIAQYFLNFHVRYNYINWRELIHTICFENERNQIQVFSVEFLNGLSSYRYKIVKVFCCLKVWKNITVRLFNDRCFGVSFLPQDNNNWPERDLLGWQWTTFPMQLFQSKFSNFSNF